MLPAVAQAQFTYTNTDGIWTYATNNGYLTITAFTGSGSVTVPSSITFRLKVFPFNNVTWPVTCIGDGAFSEYYSSIDDRPASITIPDSVINIGNYVFEEALNLTNLVIGAGVASIGTNGFLWTSGLKTITVNSTNASYSSVGGVLFDKSQAILIQYPTGNPAASYTIPNGVTNIGDVSFFLSFYLTNVAIPTSVINIGNSAFQSCPGLRSVTMGINVTSIGIYAFEGCSSISSIIIPNSVKSIGSAAFEACGLTSVTIPNGITSIASQTFDTCGSLTNIIIPNSVTSIGGLAFNACYNLKSVWFSGNSPTPTNDLSVFQNDNIATVYYLPRTTGWGTTFDGLPTVLWLPQMQPNNASFGVLTNQFGYNINWASGQIVVVEACTNLANPTWISVQTNTLTSGTAHFSDSQWTNYPGRFYRLFSP